MNAREKLKRKMGRRSTYENTPLPGFNMDSSLSKTSNKKISKKKVYFTPRCMNKALSQKNILIQKENTNSNIFKKKLLHFNNKAYKFK